MAALINCAENLGYDSKTTLLYEVQGKEIEFCEGNMNEYRFARKLTEGQANYLTLLIGHRRGSHLLVREKDDAVIGCIADESDFSDFLSTYPKLKYEQKPTFSNRHV